MTGRLATVMTFLTVLAAAALPLPSSAMAQTKAPAGDAAGSSLSFAAPAAATKELSTAEVEKLMTLRTLGDAKAPVKLTEFASLSCPHCAEFYKDTFPKLKSEYIDKGKVQYTYVDFPLNAPALSAAAVALCVPPDNYFKFVDYLFQTQQQWVFSDKSDTVLLQDGKLIGADGDKLQRCLNSKLLKSGVAMRMQKEGQEFGIDSTPTFVFDNDKTSKLSGALTFETLSKLIDRRLAAKK